MMNNFRRWTIGLIIAAAMPVAAQDVAELKSLVVNRTDVAAKAVGIVIGLIDASGQQIITGGTTAPGATSVPDGDTLFEIGSITKVFTSLLLADMIQKGELKPDDPVEKYLPPQVKMPSRSGRQITLIDLSTQVSGLPRLPDNFKPVDPADPYADYGPTRLYEFLSGYTLSRDIREKYEYSNLGVGLLGHVLALKAGLSYENLVRRRILEPLEMKNTTITLSDSLKKRLATGTDTSLRPAKNWEFDALAGAGALRSTANDMLKFLAAAMDLRNTPLRPAFDRMLQARRPTGVPDLDIAMGWHIWTKYGTEIIWHNGGTGGYRSFAGFEAAKKKGVVVLCNTSFGVDDLGLHALESRWPVARFRPPFKGNAMAADESVLLGYVGVYELGPGHTITVTRSGARLYIQETGRPMFEYLAKSRTEFFRVPGDEQVTFVEDPSGVVTHLVFYKDGFDFEAKKIK